MDRRNHLYKTFEIPKKNKAPRIIQAPFAKLKYLQKSLNIVFQALYTPPLGVYGFVENKSILDNAKLHLNKLWVYNIDLENFFPSITQHRILEAFKHAPFSLYEYKNKEIIDTIYFSLIHICCLKYRLPQGAPTSPVLSNIVCHKLDKKLMNLALKYKLSYTRYADDITFSGNQYLGNFEEIRAKIIAIIQKERFLFNEEKERIQLKYQQQIVTGIKVNKIANISRKTLKDIRFYLMCWKKFGIENTQLKYQSICEENNKNTSAHFINVLQGKINYLGFIKGKENPQFINLNTQFKQLLKDSNFRPTKPISQNNYDLDLILELWENEGLEKAMDSFE